jgi:hypothetical protein
MKFGTQNALFGYKMLRKIVLTNEMLSHVTYVFFIQFIFKSLFCRSAENSIRNLI